jgi:hypothetical protein
MGAGISEILNSSLAIKKVCYFLTICNEIIKIHVVVEMNLLKETDYGV